MWFRHVELEDDCDDDCVDDCVGDCVSENDRSEGKKRRNKLTTDSQFLRAGMMLKALGSFPLR